MMQTTALHTTSVGKPLYNRMKAEFDFGQILWTMARYNQNMSKEEAERLLDAFLQWVSIVPLKEDGAYVTMFQTPVEEAFHCFVLNTRLYKKFCEEFLGFFFHHDPLVQEPGEAIVRAAQFTVEKLEEHFGKDLNPELKKWREQFDAGTYTVACVGPGGHC